MVQLSTPLINDVIIGREFRELCFFFTVNEICVDLLKGVNSMDEFGQCDLPQLSFELTDLKSAAWKCVLFFRVH